MTATTTGTPNGTATGTSIGTSIGTATALDFRLPSRLEAHEPPEARGIARDHVRMLVGRRDPRLLTHHRFDALPEIFESGDVLVVNTSGTMPAALDTTDADSGWPDSGSPDSGSGDRRGALVVHVSTQLPDGEWVIELRRHKGNATEPYSGGMRGQVLSVVGDAHVRLVRPYTRGRLWVADFDVPSVPAHLMRHGRPIRYSYVDWEWPIETYSSVFATGTQGPAKQGSAEMPSASRPFTESLVTRLVSRGIVFAPITLHTGVASPEAHEKPYPERFNVSPSTARLVNEARSAGGRIIGVGTTAVRALESAADERGHVRAAGGWTSLVVTPASGVRAIDGLITGFHEPRASHLDMLTAIAGNDLLAACYTEALRTGYLWHEFGDINLLMQH